MLSFLPICCTSAKHSLLAKYAARETLVKDLFLPRVLFLHIITDTLYPGFSRAGC